MKKQIVYLTGLMGSGKSTIGPILANTIGYDYLDIDKQIEDNERRAINEIFSTNGEKHFREVEHGVLNDVSKLRSVVVSLGGGTVAKNENLLLVKNTGVLIYLKADPRQIFERLRYKTDRPLLKAPNGGPPSDKQTMDRIRWLIKERDKFYNQADVIVETDDRKVGLTVDEIVRKIRNLIE
ncbi:MAG: shikimate kinase [Bacteroidota bacterium]